MKVSHCSDELQLQDVEELVGVICFRPTDFQCWACLFSFPNDGIPCHSVFYIWKYLYFSDYGVNAGVLQKIQQSRECIEKEVKIVSCRVNHL